MVYTLCDDLMELIGQQVENIRLEKYQIEHKQLFDKTLDLFKIRGERIQHIHKEKQYQEFLSFFHDHMYATEYDKYYYDYEFEDYINKHGDILHEWDEGYLMKNVNF
eukprot:COSAG05_NODE_5_length_47078_cov_547.868814_19_plen_107_part_00